MRVRAGEKLDQRRATQPRRPPAPGANALLELSRTAGNRAVCRVLERRVLARQPEKDAPGVATALYGKAEEREIAKAFDLLATAEAMKFYRPVLRLAGTGKVLNPDGLMTTVKEFYAKSRVKSEDKKATPHTEGLVAELLHALDAAEAGKFVQLGAWRPDHLQASMAKLTTQFPALAADLEQLKQTELPMDQGWGGDVTVWEPGSGGKLNPTTFQHKVIDAVSEDTLDTELRKAVQQLAGQNTEKALPGRRVAELLVAHPDNPLHGKQLKTDVQDRVFKVLDGNTFGGRKLLTWVDEVIVSTHAGQASYVVVEQSLKLASIRDASDPVKALLDQKPKDAGGNIKQPPAKHSEEQLAYERSAKARKGAEPKPEKAVNDAKRWLATSKPPENSTELVAWNEQREKHLATVAEYEKTKKATMDQWDIEHAEDAERIVAHDVNVAASSALATRRKTTRNADWIKLNELRNGRVNWVKFGIAEESDDSTDLQELEQRLANDWADTHKEPLAEIQRLEGELIADVWFLPEDDEPLKAEMKRIVAAEKIPDYVGTGASRLSGPEKQQRRELAKQRADTERVEHKDLADVLAARTDEPTTTAALQKVGAVKHSEGNRAAIAKAVKALTASLAKAWNLADSSNAIDKPLLTSATRAIAKINAGVGYIGLLGEVNEVIRQAQLAGSGGGQAMIGQWYAYDQELHSDWQLADAAARTTQNTSVAQEVDVSRVDTVGTLHLSEVAADISVLEMKLLSKGKEKQRESYLKLKQKRNATLTYVVDSDRDWTKIFVLGAEKGAGGMNAPMIRWLVANDVRLVVAGTVHDEGTLKSAYADTMK